MDSPFKFHTHVEGYSFIARSYIIDQITSTLFRSRDLGNIWLLGAQQSGITSTLKYLEHKYNSNKVCTPTSDEREIRLVYFDCQNIEEKRNFFDEVAHSINTQLELDCVFKGSSGFTTDIFKQIQSKNQYLILLLDEFDSLFTFHDVEDIKASEKIVKDIRSKINGIQHLKGQPKLLSAVFGASYKYSILKNQMSTFGSDLNFLEIELEWFEFGELKTLCDIYLKNKNIKFSNEEIEFCHKLSCGHPKLSQLILDIMYKEKANGNLDKSNVKSEFLKTLELSGDLWKKDAIRKKVRQFLDNWKINAEIDIPGLAKFSLENK